MCVQAHSCPDRPRRDERKKKKKKKKKKQPPRECRPRVRAAAAMFHVAHLGNLWAATGASTWLPCALLALALTRALWAFRWRLTRDPRNPLPLPGGSMGWPVVGETLHWLVQGSDFHVCRRRRHGNVFKTHLLGKPVIRVTGAENIRKILMGEHSLVCTQWPQSTRIILGPNTLVNSTGDAHARKRKVLAKVFSRGALESYLPRLRDVVRRQVAEWCARPDAVDVYAAAKSLTFRIAVSALLGLRLDEERVVYLGAIFEQLMDNLFSLPFDAPLSGLRKGIRAREILHANMEKIIAEKMEQRRNEHLDAFDYMLSGAKEHGQDLSVQELKETAVELIFAAHSTTASASTSLLLQLLCHPAVVRRLKAELDAEGLTSTGEGGEGLRAHLSLDEMSRLRYLDCVIKEVLRFLPPVSGGYRTALQTFELDGYQVPKGWSVMYSIRDTHETAAVFRAPELFDPERFGPDRAENHSSRFSYVPFGGGLRSCVGKELAQIVLKTLAVELVATCKWTLATRDFPKMQTVPIVHPVNGLHVRFTQNRQLS
ncbi:cytochrome P450 26C1 isoform X1 [Phyllopteryx taeniolatus]|uniref:cytochrome P450 26C1 isoform X1 n=2 Tax=Phyllopteryx taeniolatus TaxID=161469 RepID=UPI002AD557BE|nr:cytochrome P450 26C1 isoform X1 [Phyllopteryx taeniolatus]